MPAADEDDRWIAIDFDGVLFDQIPHLIEGFERIHGVDVSDLDAWTWNLAEHPAVTEAGLEDDEVWEVFGWLERQQAFHDTDPLDPDTRRVIEGWVEAGHHVHIVSSRRPQSRPTAKAFLERNDIPHHKLRTNVFPKIGYDVLVDDLPPNVDAAADDGGLALLFDRPYNRHYEANGNPRRVDGWAEVESVVAKRFADP